MSVAVFGDHWWRGKPTTAPVDGRVDAIDFARGVAVTLMILSHGIKGLLDFEQIPGWGMVPVHALTKFSSTLFIMVFGIALAVAFLPHVGKESWPRKRLKLLLAGVTIFFWYKVLTVVEMFQLAEPEQIIDALLYQTFPSFVEILGFYAIALIWVPFFLSLWVRMPLWLRVASPVLLALAAELLASRFGFWGNASLRAILVEHDELYTWGQLSRGPLILLGLLLGELILFCHPCLKRRMTLGGGLLALSVLLFGVFFWLGLPDVYDTLYAIAMNDGKHPPELTFMVFSMAGALAILGVALVGGNSLARVLKPITIIGSDAKAAFIFHISVIFVVFRYLLGYWHSISYDYALTLTFGLIIGTALWIKLTAWIRSVR
ncbi:MAG: heparan-alpha-glucosaminide N-acetyltransferase domain-containing protein [Marinobacter sp.]|uniref:heparan-alpha-glucosaminide N-acetyltransferase domain-containing protein n=1 Tax=Marinobacter sp. TaxID=50741 RepID=UPI0035615842